MCSTDSTKDEPRWGQFLSISTKFRPHHSFTTTALWTTNMRKAVSFWGLCLCKMIFQLGEVEGGMSFFQLPWMDFLRVCWVVIHFFIKLDWVCKDRSNQRKYWANKAVQSMEFSHNSRPLHCCCMRHESWDPMWIGPYIYYYYYYMEDDYIL